LNKLFEDFDITPDELSALTQHIKAKDIFNIITVNISLAERLSIYAQEGEAKPSKGEK